MSDSGKAVFLSYASQDAEAAKRICEALRVAGIEVWFDQSELVGGDQWDGKIRGQIGSCALFMPVISANTQARLEGYFRIEWKIAARRTHAMASAKAFLLPIVIDDTHDASAHVPDEFRDVQWTKLADGETPPAFCARVKKLLGGAEMEAGRPRPATSPVVPSSRGPMKWWWVLPMFGVAMALALVMKEGRKEPPPPVLSSTAVKPVEPVKPAASLSEARQLAEKAWQLSQVSKNSSPDGLRAAGDLAEKATQLDSTDAEVWATAGMVDTRCWVNGADRTEKREEMARTKILRAKGLAPRSIRVRMAEAKMLTELDLYPDGFSKAKAEAILRELLQENLAGWERTEVLGVLGLAISLQGRGPEAVKFLEQAGQTDAGWMNAASWTYLSVKMFPEALAAARRQTEMDRNAGLLQQALIQLVREDLDAALAALDQLPTAARTEELPASARVLIAFYRRDASAMQAAGRSVPGDFVANQFLNMPKPAIDGYAALFAGRLDAARVEFDAALGVVNQRLAVDRKSFSLMGWKIWLLCHLGRAGEADQTYRTLQQLRGGPGYDSESYALAILGRKEEALARLETELRQPLNLFGHLSARFDPDFDPLRGDPRFEKLLRDTLPAGAKPFDDQKTDDGGQKTAQAVDQKSVAVLAFANLSDDKANEYFSDGISEELLNVLAKIPGLKVAARTSAFYFKGKEVPIPEIAKQLGVAYVVEGSVRKAGDKVRITAQLIKAADGFHVWSDTFTRDIKDVFAVQDEIAGLIAKNLELKMGMVAARPTVDLEAYQEYLTGRALVAKAHNVELREAVRHFEKAVAIEPKFTAAWVQLASAHTQLGRWGGAPTRQAWAAARAAIDEARVLEPDSPDVWLALGWILRTADWNWRGAEQAFRRALELRPSHPDTLSAAAVLLFNIGRREEALRFGRQAVELDPLNAATQIDLSLIFYFSEQWAEQEKLARRAIQLAPAGDGYHGLLAYSLIGQRRFVEAEAEARRESDEVTRFSALGMLAVAEGQTAAAADYRQQLKELYRRQGDTADLQLGIAVISAGLGDRDDAFAALEKIQASRDAAVSWLRNDIYLRSLHADPRWDALLHKVGLADEQLK